ncbi:hypothetical protein ACFPRL_08145 [Pseudoclavibacter helvolus]
MTSRLAEHHQHPDHTRKAPHVSSQPSEAPSPPQNSNRRRPITSARAPCSPLHDSRGSSWRGNPDAHDGGDVPALLGSTDCERGRLRPGVR